MLREEGWVGDAWVTDLNWLFGALYGRSNNGKADEALRRKRNLIGNRIKEIRGDKKRLSGRVRVFWEGEG